MGRIRGWIINPFATLAIAFQAQSLESGYAVWLYYHVCLSYRDVEEFLAQRGIYVCYESIRRWCHKFGQAYANQLKRRFALTGEWQWPHYCEHFSYSSGHTNADISAMFNSDCDWKSMS